MGSAIEPEKADRRIGGWIWLTAVLCLFCLSLILAYNFSGRTMRLQPAADSSADQYILLAIAAATILSAVISTQLSSQMNFQGSGITRAKFIQFCTIGACFSAGALAIGTSSMISDRTLFPPEQTRTYHALLPIDYAYIKRPPEGGFSRRRGDGLFIHIKPGWPELPIIRRDYTFMLKHRPGGHSADPNLIWSKGYFCRPAVLQQAGQAIRMIRPGLISRRTVIICPRGTLVFPVR